MKTVRRLFAFALVLVCLGAVYILPASAMTRIPEVYIDNEQDYNAYLEEGDGEIPAYFVTAEELRPFGSFRSMTSEDNVIESYSYSLTAQNGESVSITVVNRIPGWGLIEEKGTLNLSLVDSDMRTLKEEVSGTIVRQGVEYNYRDGALTEICWMTNEFIFRLNDSNYYATFANLPEDSLITRLLSTDQEAFASARQELVQISDGELTVKKTALQEFLTYDLPLTLLIVAGICLFFVIRKRKKTCRNHFFVPAT